MALSGLLGAGISSAGGLLGAKSQNAAARDAFNYDANTRTQSMNRANMAMFGFDPYLDSLTAGEGGSQRSREASARFNASIGGPIHDQLRMFAQQGQDDLAGNLRRFDAQTPRLAAFGRGAEGIAQDYGAGREAVIRQDFKDTLGSMNRQSAANLSGLGMNSLVANQQAGNASRVAKGQADALTSLGMQKTDRVLGARQVQAGREYGRDSERTTLGNQTAAGMDALRRQPLNAVLQSFTDPAFNRAVGGSSAGYLAQAGASPLGSLFANAGNSISTLGPMLAMMQMFGGGGGGGGSGGASMLPYVGRAG
jgi:hypothetical protein